MSIVNYGVSKHYAGSMVSDRCPLGYLFMGSFCILSWPEVIKLFSYSTQLSTKLILLINVKMHTIVGILTFISKDKTASESFKARKIFIFQHFTINEQLKFNAQLS